MRNNWFWNEGPRGRRYGHSRRYRNSTGSGLIGLLIVLIGLPVMVPLLCAAIIAGSALIGGLAAGFVGIYHAFRALFATSFSGVRMIGGVAMGVLIGLIAYRMIRARKEARAAEEAADRNDDLSASGTCEEENDLTEPQSYRSFNA